MEAQPSRLRLRSGGLPGAAAQAPQRGMRGSEARAIASGRAPRLCGEPRAARWRRGEDGWSVSQSCTTLRKPFELDDQLRLLQASAGRPCVRPD